MPVPRKAGAKTPVVIFATSNAGMSPVTRTRNDGVPVEPSGAPKNLFVVWVCQAPVSDPVVVTGEPDTENSAGRVRPTEVTVPVFAVAPVAMPFNLVLSAADMLPATLVDAAATDPVRAFPEKPSVRGAVPVAETTP